MFRTHLSKLSKHVILNNNNNNNNLHFVFLSKYINRISIFQQRTLNNTTEGNTHFGNESVTMKEKAEKVHQVFQNVASKYDVMNDLMSGGIHRLWKDYFVRQLNPKPGISILDVAGGTGDITFRILNYLRNQLKQLETDSDFRTENDLNSSPNQFETTMNKAVVLDISEKMLEVGRERCLSSDTQGCDIKWVVGDAQQLPFPDNSFDAYVIAYGMRNVPDIQKALQEAYRVLRIGGRFMCLEFSQVNNPLIKSVYDAYSFQVIPVLGQIVTADWESYQYLVESIRKFPGQEEFKSMLDSTGFRKVTYENLTFGVTAIHSGFKI